MPPRAHAKLSASGSSMWINCPGSYGLTKDLPDVETSFAEEGTRAHAYCEYLVRKDVNKEVNLKEVIPDNKEMEICGKSYLEFMWNKYIDDWEDFPLVEVEQRVDFSPWVKEGFGTCDCLMVKKDKLVVIDFKYGKGVKVEAKGNTQLRLYALGALNRFDLCDFKTIEMNIFQPRLDHISTEEIPIEELMQFGEFAKKASTLAYSCKGPFKAGPWCQFCKVNAICKERAKKPLETIQKILEIGGNKQCNKN